jgi:hypothetical protein
MQDFVLNGLVPLLAIARQRAARFLKDPCGFCPQ